MRLMPARWRRRRPLSCQEIVELVTAYVEGTLDERERERVEAHLEPCDACTEYVAQLRTTIRVTGNLNHAALPGEVRERLLDAFREWRREAAGG